MRNKLTLQREARARALRIQSARCVACATPSQSRPLPTVLDFATLEQIAPCFEYDADLEQFLRQNDLTYALEQYLSAQNERATN